MQLDKEFVLDELRKQGKNEHVQKAIEQLPTKIDHEQHAALLEKLGIDPGKLVTKAAEQSIGGGSEDGWAGARKRRERRWRIPFPSVRGRRPRTGVRIQVRSANRPSRCS